MHQNLAHRERPDEFSLTIHHKNLIGVIRERLKAPQKPQHDFQRHILADREHLKIHARTDAVLGITHRRAQLSALFVRQPFLNFSHHVGRQVFHQVGDFVGVEGFHRVHQLVAVHRVDQGFADAVVDFNKNIAFAFRINEFPHRKTIILRQGFQYVGNIGGVQIFENFSQFFLGFFTQRRRIYFVRRLILGVFAAVFLRIKNLRDARQSLACVIRIHRPFVFSPIYRIEAHFFHIFRFHHSSRLRLKNRSPRDSPEAARIVSPLARPTAIRRTIYTSESDRQQTRHIRRCPAELNIRQGIC